MPARRYGPVDERVRQAAVANAHNLIAAGWSRTAAARVVAADIGRHYNTIANWVRDAEATAPPSAVIELQAQIRNLTAQLEQNRALIRCLVDEHHNAPEAPGRVW